MMDCGKGEMSQGLHRVVTFLLENAGFWYSVYSFEHYDEWGYESTVLHMLFGISIQMTQIRDSLRSALRGIVRRKNGTQDDECETHSKKT